MIVEAAILSYRIESRMRRLRAGWRREQPLTIRCLARSRELHLRRLARRGSRVATDNRLSPECLDKHAPVEFGGPLEREVTLLLAVASHSERP